MGDKEIFKCSEKFLKELANKLYPFLLIYKKRRKDIEEVINER